VWLIGSLSAASVRDARADGAACSNRDALTELLRRHHDFSAKVDVQQCAAIRTRQLRSTWVVVAMFQQPPKKADDDATQYTHDMFVLDADGAIVASVQLGAYSARDMGKSQDERVTDLRSADLDGDGTDEVLLDENQGRWAVESKLDVFQVSGKQLKLGLSVPLGYEDGGKSEHPTSCSGRWTLSGRQIVVTNGERTGPERERVCPPPGTTAYALQGGRFFKQPGVTVTTTRPTSSSDASQPWVDHAILAAIRLMKSGEGERIARSIQQLTHPSGNNPQLRTYSVRPQGRRAVVLISTAWQGGFTGSNYVTDIVWELDEQGHVAATIASDNAPISVAASNARQLDDYFRRDVYSIFRNVMEAGAP
jgi:hypothetical protein